MKNFYLATLIFISFFANSQKVDYDHSSKWFLGFNVGGTWQNTDVKNQTSAGWGLILGKSFNYDYGKVLSFDLRGRYLRGYWYGQDLDTTSLANYTGTSLKPYTNTPGFNGPGYIVNNFQADVHRLALELAVHLNSIAEKTGFDPYVFGGVGVTWNQTYGDLFLNDSTSLYNYSSLIANGPINASQLDVTLDNIYDSPLDGSKKTYSAYFMPSLGFGLGYHIGKRTTLGIEHKTTFTLRDDFDGYVSSTPRAKNDIYHYTSAYLKFRFKVRGDGSSSSSSNGIGTNSNGNISNFTTNCPVPVVTINNQNNLTVNNASFKIEGKITEVTSNNSITLTDNNNLPVTFTFNSISKSFEANVTLKPGINTFILKAENTCGKDSKTLTVNYVLCDLPAGNFTNPSNNQTIVQNPNFVITALLKGIQNSANITLYQNGTIINTPGFNTNTGILQSNVVLQPGLNSFKIDFSNNCGTGSISTTVNYNNCVAPSIQFVTPTAAGTTFNSSNFKVTARISNLNNGKLTVSVNGINWTNFTVNNGQVEIPLTLNAGNNTISLNVTNACGTDTESTSIIYQTCDAPIVSISSPIANSVVTNPVVSLKGKVENVAGKQFIKVLLNNINVPVFNYNTTTKLVETTLTLVPGNNTITISSTNNCGSDIETLNIEYDACKTPVVSIQNSNATVTNSSFILNSTIQNMPSSQGITLTQNGIPVNFSFVNGNLSSSVSLNPGVNTFVLTATRLCGTSSKTLVINYNNCVPPVISLLNPVAAGITVNNSSYNFKATVSNITSNQGITFKFNGVNTPFTFTNGLVQANLTLINGNNSFLIEASNACGTDNESSSVNLVNCTPPQISVVNPSNNVTVTNSGFNYQATILGVSNASAITFKQNGQAKAFTFINGQLNSTLSLIPGANNITLTVINDCGNDIETNVITYDNCVPPVITISNPTQYTLTTTNSQFQIQAQITNSTAQGITLTQNGTNAVYSFLNGTLNSTLTLVPGNNTIAISSLNSCGNDVEFINVTYNNCIAPLVSIISPAISGTTVNSASYNFKASVQNVTSLQGIILTMNGNIIQGATLNNGVISANVTLIPGLNSFSISATNLCGNDSKTSTINFNNCTAPILNLTSPTNTGLTVINSAFNLTASVQNISSIQEVSITLNGAPVTNANLSNGQIAASVNLVPGVNNFYLTATNSCGNDTKSFTIIYDNCKAPAIQINTPVTNDISVVNSNYTFNASVQNMTNAQGIVITLNGNVVSGVNYSNGQVSANVILTPGLNTFVITATNGCGSDTKTKTITFNNCDTPIINVTSPTNTGLSVINSAFNIIASVQNISSIQEVSISLNGSLVTNANLSNGQIEASVNLVPGENNFYLTATNSCGNDTKSFTIIYHNCKTPAIQINTPATNDISVVNSNYTFNASVQNITTTQGIVMTLNGNTVSGINYSNGQVSANVILTPGLNTFVIKATNGCGSDTKTKTITFNNCSVPAVSITNPTSGNDNVFNSNFIFSGLVQNMISSDGVVLTLNGNPISNINFSNGQVTANVTLIPGINTFTLTATNGCGNDNALSTITFDNCVAPIVKFTTDSISGTVTSATTLLLSAEIINYSPSTAITIRENGNIVNSYNNNNGIISKNVNLPIGTISIEITASNNCGTDTKTYTITRCDRATITLQNPITEAYTTTNSSEVIIFNVTNVSSSEISITQNGNALSGFTLTGTTYQGQVNLISGLNTFDLSINTNCSQVTKTITIEYVSPSNPINNSDGGTNNNGNGTGGSIDGHDNNGHGNNTDGVDSSNPGQGGGGPNGQTDTNGGVDDENGTQNSGSSGSQNSNNNTPTNGNGSNSNGNNPQNGNGNGNKNANSGNRNQNPTKPTTNVTKPNQNSKPENTNNGGNKPTVNKQVTTNPTPTNISKPENSNGNAVKENNQKTEPSKQGTDIKTEPQKPVNKPKGNGGGR